MRFSALPVPRLREAWHWYASLGEVERAFSYAAYGIGNMEDFVACYRR